jgi:hypothetical protein
MFINLKGKEADTMTIGKVLEFGNYLKKTEPLLAVKHI